jgi:Tfp pilus assembly protein PilF
MRSWLVLAVLLLAACAAPAPAPKPPPLLNDAAFDFHAVPAHPEVFAVSASMRSYLKRDIARQLREEGALRGLVAALANDAQLKLEYDGSFTRTAVQAFEARAGNCLSLTVMTAALARELGLQVTFQRVRAERIWTRSGGTLFSSGHVNVVLHASPPAGSHYIERVSGVVVDFTPGVDLLHLRSQEISESMVVAMFMNNRAAERLRAGALDEAYGWARGAALADPRDLEAYNTLGVIYSRHGDEALAERVFRYVLGLEPDNVSAIANLIGVLERQGRRAETLALGERLRRIEAYPPFHFYDLGVAALKRKDYAAARDAFLRELDRNTYYHEAHFGLAVAYVGLGEPYRAEQQLATALETSTNRRERDIYAAKMAWLRSHGAH